MTRKKPFRKMKRREKTSKQSIEEREVCSDLETSLDESCPDQKDEKSRKNSKKETDKISEICCSVRLRNADVNDASGTGSYGESSKFSGSAKEWLIQEIKNLNSKAIERISEQFAKNYQGKKFSMDDDFKVRFLECMTEISKGWRGTEEFNKIYEAMIATAKESNLISSDGGKVEGHPLDQRTYKNGFYITKKNRDENAVKTTKSAAEKDFSSKADVLRGITTQSRMRSQNSNAHPNGNCTMRSTHIRGRHMETSEEESRRITELELSSVNWMEVVLNLMCSLQYIKTFKESTDDLNFDPHIDHLHQHHSCDNKNKSKRHSPNSKRLQDGHHCDCCYYEVFEHPLTESRANRVPLIRERLRMKLKRRGGGGGCGGGNGGGGGHEPKGKDKDGIQISGQSDRGGRKEAGKEAESSPTDENVRNSVADATIEQILEFINSKDSATAKAAANRAAKRARQKQRKQEEKMQQERIKKLQEEKKKAEDEKRKAKEAEELRKKEEQRALQEVERKRRQIELELQKRKANEDRIKAQQKQKEQERQRQLQKEQERSKKKNADAASKNVRGCKKNPSNGEKIEKSAKLPDKDECVPKERIIPSSNDKMKERQTCLVQPNGSGSIVNLKGENSRVGHAVRDECLNSNGILFDGEQSDMHMSSSMYRNQFADPYCFHLPTHARGIPFHDGFTNSANPLQSYRSFSTVPPTSGATFMRQPNAEPQEYSRNYLYPGGMIHPQSEVLYVDQVHSKPNEFAAHNHLSNNSENWTSNAWSYCGMSLSNIEENLSNLNLSTPSYNKNTPYVPNGCYMSGASVDPNLMSGLSEFNEALNQPPNQFIAPRGDYQPPHESPKAVRSGFHVPHNRFRAVHHELRDTTQNGSLCQPYNEIMNFDGDQNGVITTNSAYSSPLIETNNGFNGYAEDARAPNHMICNNKICAPQDQSLRNGGGFDCGNGLNRDELLTDWTLPNTNGVVGCQTNRSAEAQMQNGLEQDYLANVRSMRHTNVRLSYDRMVNDHFYEPSRNSWWVPKPIPPEESRLSWEVNLKNLVNNKIKPFSEDVPIASGDAKAPGWEGASSDTSSYNNPLRDRQVVWDEDA